jgi:spore germination protein
MTIIATVISVGVFSIASDMAQAVGTDAWIFILAAGIVNIFAALIIVNLNCRFPGKTLAEYAPQLIGKLPSKLLLLGFVAYLVFILAYETRAFTEVVKMFLLFRTPTEIIMISLLLVCTYVVRGGVECVARLNELLFPIIFIPFILILLPGLGILDFSNLMPILQTPPEKYLKAIPISAYNFGGFELMLFYIGFMKKPKKAYKAAAFALAFVTLFFTFVTVVCIAAFGQKPTQLYIWPLMTYIRNIDLPGLFIDRLDGIVLSLWIMTVFTTLISVYFIASYSLSKILGTKEQKQYVLPLTIVAYYIALQPDSLVQLLQWGNKFFPYATPFMMYGLPLFLLMIALLRKKGVKGNEKA